MDELKYQERPEFLVYAAFQFNPESQDLTARMNLPGVLVLQVKMNDDLVTGDIRKNVKTDESFWLVGQPDIELVKVKGKSIVFVFWVLTLRRCFFRWEARESVKRELVELELVNQLRPKAKAWRESGYPEITGVTRELLEH